MLKVGSLDTFHRLHDLVVLVAWDLMHHLHGKPALNFDLFFIVLGASVAKVWVTLVLIGEAALDLAFELERTRAHLL